jgi:anti-sigma factor RsiW
MSPIDPSELSALLDGELPAWRAEEVRQALAADPGLRSRYEQLARLDTVWKASAAHLAVPARVSLGQGIRRRRLRMAGTVLGLLSLRLVLKLVPMLLGAGLALVVFVFVAGWGLSRLLRESDEDCRGMARRPTVTTA